MWLYGESESVWSGLLLPYAQMVAEQDVPTCNFAHMHMHMHTRVHTYIQNNHICMNAYVNTALLHTHT